MIKFVFEKRLPSFQLVGYDEDEEKEKNGAHKHCSLFSKTLRQNIHVMLSYANITTYIINKQEHQWDCKKSRWNCLFVIQDEHLS